MEELFHAATLESFSISATQEHTSAMIRWVGFVNLVLACLATTAPVAHVLEMASKLRLPGPLWLAVQQRLYQGWGAVFGPVEILALLTSVGLVAASRRSPLQARTYLLASVCYAAMIGVFFLFNDPVNRAVSGWTAATLPPAWPDFRLRWETGHALAALLSLTALVALIRARSHP